MNKSKQFKKIYIEIVNYCNFECKFCPKTQRKKEHMSVSNFKKAAVQAKEFADVICLHLMGEPTLHPNFEQVLQICDELNVNADLVTNGSRIQEVGENILSCKAIKKVCFSLNAYNAAQKKEVESILDFAVQAGDVGKIVELRLFDENEVFVYAKEYLKCKAITNVFFRFTKKFKWPEQTQNNKKERTAFCLGGKQHIGILVDGTVVPCCLDSNGKIQLGNIFRIELKDIVNSHILKEFVKNFENRKPSEAFCKTCRFIK